MDVFKINGDDDDQAIHDPVTHLDSSTLYVLLIALACISNLVLNMLTIKVSFGDMSCKRLFMDS